MISLGKSYKVTDFPYEKLKREDKTEKKSRRFLSGCLDGSLFELSDFHFLLGP
jgi:hypothetical protein